MIKYPDYDRSILSIASSVLKHFNVIDCEHKSLPEFDNLLKKNYNNVIVMLFDGMGTSILKKHLNENDFLRSHHLTDVSSVYPSTTVAATTSIQSGYSPLETAWLAWYLYFDEIGENVSVFKNTLQSNAEPAAEYNVAQKYIPYKSIFQRIEEVNGKNTAYYVSSFSRYNVENVSDICNIVRKLTKKKEKKYIYTYWHQPDGFMHDYGVDCTQAKNEIVIINKELEKMCNELKDSLVIVTADHGQINCSTKYLEDYPMLEDLLERPPSMETRAVNFFVKNEKAENFKKVFMEELGNDFKLLSKEEVLTENLFGYGKPHNKTKDFLGDFLAVAISNVMLELKHADVEDLGAHAGLTDDEMTVPFIVFETK